MARVNNSPLLQKLSGTLGNTFTFRQYNGETIMCKKPGPSTSQSPDQQRTRAWFAMATQLAKELLLDPETEQQYIAIAKSRNLSNAYTAANQDMIHVIHSAPWEDLVVLEQDPTCDTLVDADNAEDEKTLPGNNGWANMAAQLFASEVKKSGASQAADVNRQLADLSNNVQRCLLELQGLMTKANELTQAITELDANGKEVSLVTPADVAVPAAPDTTKENVGYNLPALSSDAEPISLACIKPGDDMHAIKPINIAEKFSMFDALWTPHIIGELNGQYVKLCKLKDDFVWHSHENEDELFMVFKGILLMDFRDGSTVEVKEGEILIVPKGVEHRPHTDGNLVFNLLFEPKETLHTGTVESEKTVNKQAWI